MSLRVRVLSAFLGGLETKLNKAVAHTLMFVFIEIYMGKEDSTLMVKKGGLFNSIAR